MSMDEYLSVRNENVLSLKIAQIGEGILPKNLSYYPHIIEGKGNASDLPSERDL